MWHKPCRTFNPWCLCIKTRCLLVTCKQRADHFTPMMWFDFIRWRFHLIRRRFHYSNCIRYNQNDVTQNCISPETHYWYMYSAWQIETPNLWLTQMPSQGGVGGQRFLLVFAPMCFLWNNLWSVSHYIMGSFSGWWRLVGRASPVSNPPIWKCRSGLGDHRFPFFMDLLSNYTFYTNLTFLFIGYLFTGDVTSMITFNWWKVEKIT